MIIATISQRATPEKPYMVFVERDNGDLRVIGHPKATKEEAIAKIHSFRKSGRFFGFRMGIIH